MKRTILSFPLLTILLSIFFQVNAQTEKGKFLLGGQYSLNFSSTTTTYFAGSINSYEYDKSRSIEIAPEVGYFVFNNTSIALEILYSFNKEIIKNSGYNFERSISCIPLLRYYFAKSNFKPYLQAGIGPGWRKTGNKDSNFAEQNQYSKLLIYEFKGGLGFFLNKNISFDLGFGYNSTTTFYKEALVGGTFDKWKNTCNGIGATLGIIVFL